MAIARVRMRFDKIWEVAIPLSGNSVFPDKGKVISLVREDLIPNRGDCPIPGTRHDDSFLLEKVI